MRLALRLDVAVEALRDQADRGHLAALQVGAGGGEVVVVDDFSQLGGVELLAKVAGSRTAVQVHHRYGHVGRDAVLQEAQVEDGAEGHHSHRSQQIDGPADPDAEFAADHIEYFLPECHLTSPLSQSFPGEGPSRSLQAPPALRKSLHRTNPSPWSPSTWRSFRVRPCNSP